MNVRNTRIGELAGGPSAAPGWHECERCEGLGEIAIECEDRNGALCDLMVDCPACDGWGKVRE